MLLRKETKIPPAICWRVTAAADAGRCLLTRRRAAIITAATERGHPPAQKVLIRFDRYGSTVAGIGHLPTPSTRAAPQGGRDIVLFTAVELRYRPRWLKGRLPAPRALSTKTH